MQTTAKHLTKKRTIQMPMNVAAVKIRDVPFSIKRKSNLISISARITNAPLKDNGWGKNLWRIRVLEDGRGRGAYSRRMKQGGVSF